MKTRFMNLTGTDATLDSSEYQSGNGFTIRTASGRILRIPKSSPDPAAFASDDANQVPTASRIAQNTLNTILELEAQITRVNRDTRWSDEGRTQNLLPARKEAIKTLIHANNELLELEKGLAAQRAQLYAVPQLASNDVVGYLRDQEIRDSLRALANGDLVALLSGQQAKGLSADPALILAVLRSPVKSAHLEKVAVQIWQGSCEMEDPVLHETIKIIDAALDWARMVLGLVVGIVKRELLGYAGKALFDMVYPLGGAELFGFSIADMARFKRTAA